MPDPTLQATALRYAAGDLPPDDVAAFESRLAEDQDARDALAEAVRLSAQAIGQKPPAPHPSFRAAIRDRLSLRAYRGGPLAWVSVGAATVAACTILGLALADRTEPPAAGLSVAAAPVETQPALAEPPVLPAPAPQEASIPVAAEVHSSAICGDDSHRSVAEIWAELSNHEGVEKARDDELRRRHRVRDLSHPHVYAAVKAAPPDVREP
jgi:hypothetical protein